MIIDDRYQISARNPGSWDKVSYCTHWSQGKFIKEAFVAETGWVPKDQAFPKMDKKDEHNLRMKGTRPSTGYIKEL